jgi:hypothetical protein
MPQFHSVVAATSRRATAPKASTSRPESISSRIANLGLQDSELHHLGALALAAGEVDVDEPIEELGAKFHALGLVAHACAQIERIAPAATKQVKRTNAGNFQRLLQPGAARARARSVGDIVKSSTSSMVTEPSRHRVPG